MRGVRSDIRILCAPHEDGGVNVSATGQRGFEYTQVLLVFPVLALVCSVTIINAGLSHS